MTKEQVNIELQRYKYTLFDKEFLAEIRKYYDVVKIREYIYYLPEMNIEIQVIE